MSITTIKSLKSYLNRFSNFSDDTIWNVITSLGFNPLHGTKEEFIKLSGIFKDCTEHGADSDFPGFSNYDETVLFFMENKEDIIRHMEQTASELGTDIIKMVQGFGIFRYCDKPTPSEVGRALWGNKELPDLTTLYNVFAWYVLEEVSRTWYRYLEDNPCYRA